MNNQQSVLVDGWMFCLVGGSEIKCLQKVR